MLGVGGFRWSYWEGWELSRILAHEGSILMLIIIKQFEFDTSKSKNYLGVLLIDFEKCDILLYDFSEFNKIFKNMLGLL